MSALSDMWKTLVVNAQHVKGWLALPGGDDAGSVRPRSSSRPGARAGAPRKRQKTVYRKTTIAYVREEIKITRWNN